MTRTWSQRRLQAHVLITHIVTAHITFQAIDNDDLAVVAEVDLKAIEPAATCGEGFYLTATVA